MAAFWAKNKGIHWDVTEMAGLDIAKAHFIESKLSAVYYKILFLTLRAVALDDAQENIIYPSASNRYTPKSWGFIHFVAEAMAEQKKTVIVKEKLPDNSYIFKATGDRDGTKENAANTIELDFRDFEQSEILACYYGMLFDALNGASKGIKASQGLIVFLESLSEQLKDSQAAEAVEEQVKAIAGAVRDGKTGYASDGSRVEFIKFDSEPSENAIQFCFNLIAGELGVPVAEINGAGGSAMSDTGESDRKHLRRAIEFYFISIINPVLKTIFGGSYSLMPEIENIDGLTSVLFAVESSSILTNDGKKQILSQYGLREEDINLDNPKSISVQPKDTEIDRAGLNESDI